MLSSRGLPILDIGCWGEADRSIWIIFKYSPNAKSLLSPIDKQLIEQYGAAVVECSWARTSEVPWSKIGGKCERLC